MKKALYLLFLFIVLALVLGAIPAALRHDKLDGLQGGAIDEYYHLTQTDYNSIGNWDDAYGWGDHSIAGYMSATLTEEEVEDYVGGMLGGTETSISVTYQDATGDIDFVVADNFLRNDGDDETSGNIRILTNKKLEFRNANTYLASSSDGILTLSASSYFVLGSDVLFGSYRFFNSDIFSTDVINAMTLDHTLSVGSPAAGIGTGLSFKIEDLGGSEEQGSIDVLLTTVTDDAEYADMVFSLNVGGTITEMMRLDSSADKLDITGGLTVDTDTLVIDAANDRVGIGTNAPDSIFHIKANVAGTVGSHPAGQLIIQDPDDTVFGNAVITGYESDGAGNPDQQLWYLGSSSSSNSAIIFLNRRNSKLQLGTNDVSRLTILGNGNVGIGETAPQDKLEVNGTVLVKDALKFTQDDGNEYIDSLNDGYMDYGATTGHRFNNDVVVTGDVTGANLDVAGWDAHLTNDGTDHSLLGATPGTASAGLALIVDASKDIDFDGGDITTAGTGRFDGGVGIGRAATVMLDLYSASAHVSAMIEASGQDYSSGFYLKNDQGNTAGFFIYGSNYSYAPLREDAMLRMDNAAQDFILTGMKAVGIGLYEPTAKLHIDQASSSAAFPVLKLDQADIDDTFIDFIGTSAADATKSISTLTTSGATTHHIKCEINGVSGWIAFSTNDPS